MIPIEHDLWSADEVAAYLKMATDYVRKHVVCLPDFPAAIRLPTSRRSHPRWRAIEVIEWSKKYQEKAA